MSTEPLPIFVFGSCVTRDCFAEPQEGLRLVDYYARCSLASFAGPSLEIEPRSITLESKFQRRQVLRDLNNTFFSEAAVSGTDLVIDLIDERFHIAAFEGGYATISNELTRSGYLTATAHRVIRVHSPERSKLWTRGAQSFARGVEALKPRSVVVHRAFWCDQYLDGAELHAFDAQNQEQIKTANAWLDAAYDELEATFRKQTALEVKRIELFAKGDVYALKAHRWGLAPFHYADTYTARFADALCKLVPSGPGSTSSTIEVVRASSNPAPLASSGSVQVDTESPASAAAEARAPARLVLFKVDDVRFIGRTAGWDRIFRQAGQLDCKLSAGIISEGYDDPANAERYAQSLAWLRGWSRASHLEFWNHGHNHSKHSFNGAPLEAQRAELEHNGKAVTPIFGGPLPVFGAPYNSVDWQTPLACAELGLRAMFYAEGSVPPGMVNLRKDWFLQGTEEIISDKFRSPRRKQIMRNLLPHLQTQPVAIVQLHPLAWTDAAFDEFGKLVLEMRKENCTFTVVDELLGRYAASLSERAPARLQG